ncbi:hypothetical protein MXD81_03880 [Microbacteriaceae bacterium K1510]|nr:hypothetical protein [Microbacteriaceae bacterium K1510]
MGGHREETAVKDKPKEKPMEKRAEKERERIEKQEDEVVVSSDESFPASDPPSFNPGVTGAHDVKRDVKKKKH